MDKFLSTKAEAKAEVKVEVKAEPSADSAELESARQEIKALKARVAELEAQLAAKSAAPAAAPAATAAAAPPPATDAGSVIAEMSTDTAFLTPRGRFKLRLCENATVLVGKSTEVVVPHSAISRAWLLPESSTAGGTLLVLGLSAPVPNGKSTISFVTLHSKPADAPLTAIVRGANLSGKAAHFLREALATLCPAGSFTVTEPGSFKPASGPALACYNKASEAACYLLDKELLVREGGKILTLPYAGMRAELLPPSGRRTFDVQIECPPPESSAAAGAAPPKPIKLELSLIAADEFNGVAAWLKKKKVNVNGSLDSDEEEGDAADGETKASGSKAAAESDDDDDDDDSEDEEDDDFAPSDGSDPEEEYDSEDGEEIAGVDEEARAEEEDEDDEDDEGEEAEGAAGGAGGGFWGDDDEEDDDEGEEDEEDEDDEDEDVEMKDTKGKGKRGATGKARGRPAKKKGRKN